MGIELQTLSVASRHATSESPGLSNQFWFLPMWHFKKKKIHGDLSFFNMNFFKKHSWNLLEIKIWTQFKNDSVPMCDVIQLEIFLPHLIFREGHSAIEESQLHWLSKAIRLCQSWFLSYVLHEFYWNYACIYANYVCKMRVLHTYLVTE